MKKVAVVVAVLTIALFVWVALGKGIRVVVENVSGVTLTSVRVEVQGTEYPLDDLEDGASDSVKVEPTAPTEKVRVRWKDSHGKDRFARVAADIDPGNTHGTVTIRLSEGVLDSHEVDLDHGFF